MVDIHWACRMAWEETVEKHFFLSCLEIIFICAVGTISDLDGFALMIKDEIEDGPNLVVEAD